MTFLHLKYFLEYFRYRKYDKNFLTLQLDKSLLERNELDAASEFAAIKKFYF